MLAASFPPLLPSTGTRVLVLGSMPGQASLKAVEYYAFRHNAFWPIMVALAEGGRPDREHAFALDYASRAALLATLGVGLWDVLAECRRAGSLDAAIERDSEVPNPIDKLLDSEPGIEKLLFNGRAAEVLYRRHFGRQLQASIHAANRPPQTVLPSTSPAHASLSLEAKFYAWRQAVLS